MPWAITFHNPWAAEFSGTPLNQPLHPTQLYEFVAEAIRNNLLIIITTYGFAPRGSTHIGPQP